jgi:hypothetical protein
MLHSAIYGDGISAHSALVVTVVLVDSRLWGGLTANPGFRGRCGNSCACLWTDLRVVLTGVQFGRCTYTDSSARPCLFKGLAEGRALDAQAPSCGVS